MRKAPALCWWSLMDNFNSFFEDRQEKEDVEMTDEDTGYLFLLLKTVVDALNKTTGLRIAW